MNKDWTLDSPAFILKRNNYRIGICHCGNQFNIAEHEECDQCRSKPSSSLYMQIPIKQSPPKSPQQVLYQYFSESLEYAKGLGYKESDFLESMTSFLQYMKKLLIEKDSTKHQK